MGFPFTVGNPFNHRALRCRRYFLLQLSTCFSRSVTFLIDRFYGYTESFHHFSLFFLSLLQSIVLNLSSLHQKACYDDLTLLSPLQQIFHYDLLDILPPDICSHPQ